MIASFIAAAVTSALVLGIVFIMKAMIIGGLEIGLSLGTMSDASGILSDDIKLSRYALVNAVIATVIGTIVGAFTTWWFAIAAVIGFMVGAAIYRTYAEHRRAL